MGNHICGIVGLIAPKATQQWKKRVFGRLLTAAAVRGSHATGLMFVDPNKGLTVAKEGKEAKDFIRMSSYTDLVGDLPALVVGHTRAATGGTAAGPEQNKNNHPFYGKLSKVALVHNGTVDDDDWRKTVGKPDGINEKYPFESETDSELFLRLIESCLDDGETSMVEAISDTAINIKGSYALAIIRESEPNKVWLVRHSMPMVVSYNEKASYIVFGSSKDIIENSLMDHEFKLDWFVDSKLPRLVTCEIEDDRILEITMLDKPTELGELFSLTETQFEPSIRSVGRF